MLIFCELVQATSSQGAQCTAAADSSDCCKPATGKGQGTCAGSADRMDHVTSDAKSGSPKAAHSPGEARAQQEAKLPQSEAGEGNPAKAEEVATFVFGAGSRENGSGQQMGTGPATAQHKAGQVEGAGASDAASRAEEALGPPEPDQDRSQQPSTEEVLGMGLHWLQSVYKGPEAETAAPPSIPDGLPSVKSLLPGVYNAPAQQYRNVPYAKGACLSWWRGQLTNALILLDVLHARVNACMPRFGSGHAGECPVSCEIHLKCSGTANVQALMSVLPDAIPRSLTVWVHAQACRGSCRLTWR